MNGNHLTFKEHIIEMVTDAKETTKALKSLMFNIGGTGNDKFSRTSHTVTINIKNSVEMNSSAKEISADAVGVIVGMHPIELQLMERR